MDSPETVTDPQNELRKLQELVKNLERQNEVLRSKQVRNLGLGNGDIEQVNQNTVNGNDHPADIAKIKLKKAFALDDFEDVNFSDLSVDDDSWLYTSPKPVTPQVSRETLLSWVRQDFDHPSPEVESSRRALICRLEEVARMRHSSSTPVISSQPFASRSAGALSRSTEEGNHTPSSRYQSHRKSGLAAPGSLRSAFDANTFTRPKRGSAAPHQGDGDHQTQEQPYNTQAASGIADIENLAKLQEENLRQSITPTNRKAMRAKHALMEGDNGARLSPSRFDLEGTYLSHHRGSAGSDLDQPVNGVHNINQHLNLNNPVDSRGRRSLPSTPGLHYQSHNSSDSSLERHSVNSDDMNQAPETTRAHLSRLQQPNHFSAPKQGLPLGIAPGLAQPRGISPQRTSGLPTPKRQLVRPSSASRSSLPMLRRTNIPSPKPSSSGGSEENWKDGCF